MVCSLEAVATLLYNVPAGFIGYTISITIPGDASMKSKTPLQLTVLYSLPFIFIITVLFLLALIFQERFILAEQALELRTAANALVQQVIVTRGWNAGHGGVYVQISEKTPPNPYLKDPERDIVSRTGKRYTKMNPAYMTREIATLAESSQGHRFKLTSARPLNPSNTADPWETTALRDFESGITERMTMTARESGREFRFMAPLKTETACLSCHAAQGYRVGDIRGGISVSIPMTESDLLFGRRISSLRIAAVALWLIISVFITVVSFTLSRKVSREIQQDLALSRLQTTIELAGAAAHEIRQPLTVIITYVEIVKKSASDGNQMGQHLDSIIVQCRRIDEILDKMRKITRYQTKPYVGDGNIIDLDAQNRSEESGEKKH